MARTVVFGVSLLLLSIGCYGLRPSRVITTDDGPVQGEILKTAWESQEYSAFKGIPYASPPLGELRFKPPVRMTPWNAVLNASREGNRCIQIEFRQSHVIGSEDCLFLNVFSPETKFEAPLKLKPVMVWIHGGSYHMGYGDSSLFGPDFFIETDVVVVTMNYRLGALGFVSLQHEDAFGNAGLKDQTEALRWVQRNIAQFGGDPNQVTIFGESAGGSSVDFHVLSDLSKGLFHRSISMSASALCSWAYSPPKEALSRAFRLASLLGYEAKDSDDLLNFLLNASATDLVRATQDISLVDPPFKPTIEDVDLAGGQDVFLPECPISKYASGKFNKHPHMMGFMKDEVLAFSEPVFRLKDWVNYTHRIVHSVHDNHPHRSTAVTDWFSKIIKKLSVATIKELIWTISGISFVAPIDLARRVLHANSDQPVYYYRVSYETEYALHKQIYNVTLDGAAHGDDLGYIFRVSVVNEPSDPNHPFNQFRKKMVRMWSNFAKYGNPTPDGTEDPLLKVNWKQSGRFGWQLDINEKFTLSTPQVDYTTRIYEAILYAATPFVTGCIRMMSDLLPIL